MSELAIPESESPTVPRRRPPGTFRLIALVALIPAIGAAAASYFAPAPQMPDYQSLQPPQVIPVETPSITFSAIPTLSATATETTTTTPPAMTSVGVGPLERIPGSDAGILRMAGDRTPTLAYSFTDASGKNLVSVLKQEGSTKGRVLVRVTFGADGDTPRTVTLDGGVQECPRIPRAMRRAGALDEILHQGAGGATPSVTSTGGVPKPKPTWTKRPTASPTTKAPTPTPTRTSVKPTTQAPPPPPAPTNGDLNLSLARPVLKDGNSDGRGEIVVGWSVTCGLAKDFRVGVIDPERGTYQLAGTAPEGGGLRDPWPIAPTSRWDSDLWENAKQYYRTLA